MSTYTLESDKIFLHCLDVGVVEVYEIESLDIAFLEKKNWKNLATINFGRNKEYEVLKIGDIEIKGRDLKRVMEDLVDSQLLVNREGLCILPTEKIKHDFEVEYYRIFDLFDWSKHGAKSAVKTRWSRRDVLRGDAMPDPEGEKERKMEELLKEYEKELSIVKESVEEYEKKLVMTKERIAELEKELKMRVFEHSDLEVPIFVSSVVDRVRIPFTAMALSSQEQNTSTFGSGDRYQVYAMVMDTSVTEEEMAYLVKQSIKLQAPDGGDTDNWWAVKICGTRLQSYRNFGIFVYYDGNMGYIIDGQIDNMPYPVETILPTGIKNQAYIYLHGIGARHGSYFADGD